MKPLHPDLFLKQKEEYLLIDVRSIDEWGEHHEKEALHVPLDELEMRISSLPKKKLAVICRSGGRSAFAAQLLEEAGFEAFNLTGGMCALLDAKRRAGLIGDEEHTVCSDAVGC